jgi:hypothetical protein
VRISCSPAIFVDATWPLQNAELFGANITFGGKAQAEVEDGHGFGSGMISIKGKVAEQITSMLDKGVAGSPFAEKGYDPTKDANLEGTLSSVQQHFTAMFAEQGGGKQGGASPVGEQEMTNVSAGGTVTVKAGGNFMKDGTGLSLDAGSDISLDAIGGGNVKDLQSAGGKPQQTAQAAKISALEIGASGMKVMSKGQPIAQITEMTIHPGGNVTIEQVQLLGKAAEAQAGESGLSLLVGLLALYAHDPAANGALQNAQDPKVVDGVAKKMMEDQFTAQIRSMILQYRTAVPGMDIAKVLGVG